MTEENIKEPEIGSYICDSVPERNIFLRILGFKEFMWTIYLGDGVYYDTYNKDTIILLEMMIKKR